MPLVPRSRQWTHREEQWTLISGSQILHSSWPSVRALGDAPCFPGGSKFQGQENAQGEEKEILPYRVLTCEVQQQSQQQARRREGPGGRDGHPGGLRSLLCPNVCWQSLDSALWEERVPTSCDRRGSAQDGVQWLGVI